MVVCDTTNTQDIWFKLCITITLGTLTNTLQCGTVLSGGLVSCMPAFIRI
jgi:hypothetical protein